MKTFKTIVGCALTAAMCVFAIAAQADVAYIDVMFALDKKAVTYLNDEKEGTTPAQYMSARLAEMNQVLVNSGLDDKFQFRSAGVYELGFEAKLVDSSKELTRDVLENATGGKGMWEDLHIERDNRGADVVSVIIDTGSEYGHVGDGNALTSIADASTFGKNAYSVVGVRSTFDYYAILHEIAHNMGAGHAAEVGAGSHVTDYAYGYYFAGNTKSYYTIMGYPKTGYSPAPIFSTPDETYDGVAAGTSTKDNVRVLEQTFLAASQWRSLPAKAHPAMSVSWNQSSPMNDFAAMAQKDGSWEKAPCGCPATAAAQMLKHYVWPMRTDSSFTGATQRYIDNTAEAFPIRFDGHNDFQWAKMQNRASDNDVVGNFETARLTMWCGAMGGTDYRVGDSSAQFDDIAESASELFQKGKSTYFFSDGAEAVWKAITNALDRGELVQVTLKGHQVVADDYRLTSGDLEVHLNYGWAGSQTGWYTRTQLSDQYSGILYVWTGFAPKKMAQLKPLAKQVASTGTIPLSWALPQMYANDLTGFMIMAYYPGDSVVSSYAGDTGTIAADRAGTYTLTGVYKLTNESSLSCTLSSYHTSGIKAELQARYDAGEWTTIATPELSTEEDEYNKGVLVKSGWLATPIAVDLSSHAGETAEFRFKISRTAKTRTKDGQIFFSKPTWTKVYQPVSQQLGLQGYPDLRSYPLSASGYAGKVVSFTIEPIMSDSVVGEPVATKVVTTAVPDLPTIVSIDSLSSSMTNGFQRTCGIGKSVFFVKANATTTAVTAAPSHLALVPDSAVSYEKVNSDTWAVMIDAEDTPANSQMILTLIAQDALGNKSYKDLQLTFRSGEGGAESEDTLAEKIAGGNFLYVPSEASETLPLDDTRFVAGKGTVTFDGGMPSQGPDRGFNYQDSWKGLVKFINFTPTQEDLNRINYEFKNANSEVQIGGDPEPDPNQMYHNTLSAGNEDIKVARGTYGTAIEVPVNGYYATAFDELTTLSTTASASIGGNYANIIKDGTYIDTHTVVGWFNVGALPTDSSLKVIYIAQTGKTDGTPSTGEHCGYKVAVDKDGKLYVGKIKYDSGKWSWQGNDTYKATSASAISGDGWFHIAVANVATVSGSTKTVTPKIFVNGQEVEVASGTFAGNLNGNTCVRFYIGAGISAAGVYVDTTALSDAAKVASFATNAYYVVKGAQPMPEPTEPLSQMYFNRLSTGSTFVTPGAHGSITVPGDGYCATAYSSATVLDNSASDPERGGAYTSVIVTSPDCNVNTHTVAGWFKIDTMPTGGNKQILWSCQNSSGDYRGYAVAVNASGELGISRTKNASLDFENDNNFSSGAGIQAGVWYHIAFSIKQNGTADPNRNAEVQLFVNGEDKGSLTSSNKLKIGCNGGAACSSFTIAAGVSAAGVYVDTQAFTKAATIKSLATNSTYLKPYVPEPTNAAKIGDTEYATVAAAIEAVTTGQTITLLKNVEENLASVAKTFTLALDGHTLSGTFDLTNAGVITLNYGSGALASTVTGSGMLVYDATIVTTFPTTAPTGLTADAWTGTVWFKGYDSDSADRTVASFRNASSTVKFTSVKGFFAAASVFSTVSLEDAGDTPALNLDNGYGGWGSDKHIEISNLTGTGTLKASWGGGGYKGYPLTLINLGNFHGSLWAAAADGVGIYVGPTLSSWAQAENGKITLVAGGTATIAEGKSWTAVDGIVINGAIGGAGTLASDTTFGDGAEIDNRNGTLNATGTLTFGASTKVRVATAPTGDVKIINKSGTMAGDISTTVSVYVGASETAESGNYKLAYKDDGVYLVAGESPYAKFDYGTVYSWVTTGSGTIEFAGDSSDLQVFDIVGGTNKTDTTYHGTTTFSSVSGGKFWHQFAYASATPMSEIYAAPGEIWRFEQGTYCNSVAAGYGPLTIGGMIVEPGATAFTFVNTESKTRTTLLGDPTATTPTFFDIGANLTFNRHGIFYLAGTLTFDIAGNTTNDLNSAQSSFDLALVNTVVSGASGAFGATTPGGTLVMKGAGTLKVATLKALGSTLDYSNQPYNRVTPYIAGTLQMDANTMIVLPAGLPESTAFKMATTLTGVEAGPVRRIIRLGNGEPAIKSVTFDTAAGTISYADDPSVFTATLTNTGYLNFQSITWDGGKTWTGGSADAYVELHIEGSGELILSLNGNVTAGTIRAVSSSANAQLKINNSDSTTLSVGTFDFSDAVGKTTLFYATGTANVVAGSDTVLTSAGSGTVTIGANKKATVPTTWTGTKSLAAQGTLVVTGGGSRNYDADMVANATVELAGSTAYTFNDNQRLTTQGTLRIAAAAGTSTGGEIGMTGNTRLEVGDGGTFTINGRFVTGYGGDSRNSTIVVNGGTLTSAGYGYLMAASGYKNCTFSLNIEDGLFSAVFAPYATSGGSGIAANNINVTVSGGTFAPSKIGTSNAGTGSSSVITEGGEDIGTVGSGKGAKVDMTGGTFNVPAIVPSWLPITVTEGNATIGVQTGAANPVVRSVITVSGGKLNLPAGLASAAVTLSAGATLNITGTSGQAAYSITTGTFANNGTVQLNGVDLPTEEYEVSDNQIVRKGSPYAKFDYGTVYSWATTGSSAVDLAGASDFYEFDIVGCTNKTTLYHGSDTTTGTAKFWHRFAYASTVNEHRGAIIRLQQGSYCTTIGGTYGAMSFGGIIAEAGDANYKIEQTSGTRDTILGDPTAATNTFFDIGANVTFNRNGKFALVGTLTFDIASGKATDLNSSRSTTLQLVGAVAPSTDGNYGATTAGGTLVMKGEGTLAVKTLQALGSTLDYRNLPYDRANAYISGTLTINDATVIKLPAELPENTAFKMATALSGANDGVRTIWLGDTQVTKNVTFANGAISYSTTIEYKTLGWDASQSAWTNGVGEVVTTIDNTCILNATAGDVITFASAVTPHQFIMPESGTVTLSTGGNLMNYAITVPSGAKLALGWNSADAYSQVISGAGAVDITGNVTLSANNTFTGALTVRDGATLKMGSTTCLGNANAATVEQGGTFDFNGQKDNGGTIAITLNGGTLTNTGSSLGAGNTALGSITLGANSTLNFANDWGLIASGHGATTLTLNGHTLTKTGSGTFYLISTTVSGAGTFDVEGGTLSIPNNGNGVSFGTAALVIKSGATLSVVGKTLTLTTLTSYGTISGGGTITGLTTLKGSTDFSAFSGTVTLADSVSIGAANVDDTVTLGNASTDGKTLNVLGGTLNLMKDGVQRAVGALSLADGSTLMVSTNTTQAAVQVNGAVNLEGKNVAVAGVLPESGAKVYLLGATSITGTGTLVNPGAWTVALENNTLTATKKPSTYITPGDGGAVKHATDVTNSLDINKELAKKVTKGTDHEVTDASTSEQVVEAMNQTGANGYKVWESAVLGLSPTNVNDKLVIKPIQSSSTTTVTLQVPTVNVDATTGADVTFCFWSKDGDGEWKEVSDGAVESGEEKELDLPASGVKYYQLRTTIKTQAQKTPVVIPSANIVASGMPLISSTGSTKTAASLGTKTLKEAAESLDVALTGSGVFEGQEYHLEVTEGASNSSSHFAIVAKAMTNTTKHVTFYFGKEVPAGTTCKLTLIEAAGNGNVAVKSDEGFEGIDPINANVLVASRLAWTPYDDGLASVSAPTLQQQYRIPAIATDGKGEVIACYDVRYGESDLGLYWEVNGYSGIDCGENYSSDGGKTFDHVHLAVDVPNFRDGDNKLIGGPGTDRDSSYMNKTNDIGDVCILFDPNGDDGKGLYWMMGLTGGGLASAGTDSCNNDVVLYTRKPGKDSKWVEWDNGGAGDHWAKRSVKQQILASMGKTSGTINKGFFEGPGHGIVTTKANGSIPAGTLVFPIQCFFSEGTHSGAAYSTDGGKTWQATALTDTDSAPQENCIMELDDGSWYMCTKCQNAGYYRCYRYNQAANSWTKTENGAPCPGACEGSCIRMGVDSNGKGRYAICHARDQRANTVVYFGVDNSSADIGITWDWDNYITVHKENTGSGYSSMCMVDDTTLGILYESLYGAGSDGGCDSNNRMYFTRIDVSDKVVPPTPEK